MIEDKIEFVVGKYEIDCTPMIPFADIVVDFLDDLSKSIMKDVNLKQYSDVITFAFWCRKSNILKIKVREEDNKIRLGRGLVFHIAPSNIPINFAFTFVFGLLSGNGNVVRMSSKKFEQCDIVCRHINDVLNIEKYFILKKQNAIIKYEHNKEITDYYSSICDARVIWGGDKTIELIRESKLPIRSVEVVFADRYSYGVISLYSIKKATEDELRKLVQNFYNDTYLVDQNACSSPHMIFWLDDMGGTSNERDDIKDLFWTRVYEYAKERYELTDKKVSDKYTMLCEKMLENNNVTKIKRYDNILYIIRLSEIKECITRMRGFCGMFFEYEIEDFKQVLKYDDKKIQTCLYYGIQKESLIEEIISKGIKGIDRIVPFGDSMSLDVIWDGVDIVKALSREILCVIQRKN